MRASERELGLRVVVELYAQPGRGVMAGRALLRESRGAVVRIIGPVEILQVAADTIGTGAREIIVGVTCGAFQLGVRAGQGEACELGVIEGRSLPAIHAVTELALGREPDRGVVGVAGFRKVGGVATAASGGKAHKLPVRGALVA